MPERRRLPDERKSLTRKFTVHFTNELGKPDEVDVYAHVGFYEDGTPGELFLKSSRMGSTVSGFMEALATSVSLGLQYGVPLEKYVLKLKGMRFEPFGMTGDPDAPIAASIPDIVARWLERRFLALPEPAP